MTTVASASGSYTPTAVVPGGLDAECVRLEQQAALGFPDELPLLREALAGRASLAEIGCGPGAVTRRLREAFPDLRITAVDVDPALLSRVRGADETVLADARAVPLPDGCVETVYLRYVLQHLADPAVVLAEAFRLLVPGGVLVVTEVDAELWGVVEPAAQPLARQALSRAYAALDEAQRAAGGDRMIGRRLTRMIRAAGFSGVGLRPFATTSDDRPVTDFEVHLGPSRWAPLLAAGRLGIAELARLSGCWRDFASDPEAWVMVLGLTAVGHRPDREHR